MSKQKQHPKNKHQWGKSFFQDFDRLIGGKGNEGVNNKSKKDKDNGRLRKVISGTGVVHVRASDYLRDTKVKKALLALEELTLEET